MQGCPSAVRPFQLSAKNDLYRSLRLLTTYTSQWTADLFVRMRQGAGSSLDRS